VVVRLCAVPLSAFHHVADAGIAIFLTVDVPLWREWSRLPASHRPDDHANYVSGSTAKSANEFHPRLSGIFGCGLSMIKIW
jgi:hypothetical protein